jgi:hypothetical protein
MSDPTQSLPTLPIGGEFANAQQRSAPAGSDIYAMLQELKASLRLTPAGSIFDTILEQLAKIEATQASQEKQLMTALAALQSVEAEADAVSTNVTDQALHIDNLATGLGSLAGTIDTMSGQLMYVWTVLQTPPITGIAVTPNATPSGK